MGQPARTGGYRASVTRWGCTAGYISVLSVRSIPEEAPQNADARVGRAITLHLLDDPVAMTSCLELPQPAAIRPLGGISGVEAPSGVVRHRRLRRFGQLSRFVLVRRRDLRPRAQRGEDAPPGGHICASCS